MTTRTQYIFDLSGVKYKSQSDIFTLRRQWNLFESVENYNYNIYQLLLQGNRGSMYYQFKPGEFTDYRNGQLQHIARYPWLPPTTFASISDKPFPNVTFTTPAPYTWLPIPQNATFSEAVLASERTKQQNDLAIYSHVSSYNKEHTYQYIFPSNEEKMAYYRAEHRLMVASSQQKQSTIVD